MCSFQDKIALFCRAYKTNTVAIVSGDHRVDLDIPNENMLDLAFLLGLNAENTVGTDAERVYARSCLDYKA